MGYVRARVDGSGRTCYAAVYREVPPVRMIMHGEPGSVLSA